MDSIQVVFRPTTSHDLELVKQTLYIALAWDPDDPIPPFDAVVHHPQIAIYHAGWMRPGDDGVVAETPDGASVGMAYCRQFGDGEGAQGFVDSGTPELAVGVAKEYRGRGIGRELIARLHETRSSAGIKHMSLSVGANNPARRLYERLGYHEARRHGDGIVMSIDLPPPEQAMELRGSSQGTP